MKRTHNLKLPNGFGSIIFLGDKRRCPYAALKTVGWDDNGKQIREYVGYGKTWNEAYNILLEYNNNPYDLKYKNITLSEVYEMVEKILSEQLDNGKTSKSNYSALISAWNCHLSKLSKNKVLDLKRKDIQDLIDKSNLKYTGRNYIKILFNKIIDYCINDLEIKVNENICKVDIGDKEKSDLHKPFSSDEIKTILEHAQINKIAKMIIIYLHTGLRPSELLKIKIDDINLNENYMIGGIKTKAGKDRIIPIHSYIKDYILYFYNKNNKYLITNETNNSIMSYDAYQNRFDKLMNQLNMNHTPHDTRHTFATKCEDVGISDVNIKILMGHSLANDVTNDVYIHKTAEKLKNEIEKIKY